MLVNCENCNAEFNKKPSDIKKTMANYCSRSCAASMNNRKQPRKVKTKKCELCDTLILSNRKKCPKCIKEYEPKDMTLKDARYDHPRYSSLHSLVRTRARSVAKKLGWTSCKKCGYDKHIEICHIKPIAGFSDDTLLSVVNHESNLIPLCPNCHWEFDNKVS